MTEPNLAVELRPEPLRIVVISSFTATPVSAALLFWANRLSRPVELSFASYGQVFQELQRYDRDTEAEAGAVAVLLRTEDFIPTGKEGEAVSFANDLTAALASAGRRSPRTTFLLAVCPSSPKVRDDAIRLHAVDDATRALRRQVGAVANVAFVEPVDVIRRYRVAQTEDSFADSLGGIPYTPTYFAALGTALIRRLHRATTPGPKVLVVDGDNTLWDGVLGEDGPSGVKVGFARQRVQEFLLEQRRAGRLLCLCSKNAPIDVEQALVSVPGMRLKPDDFVKLRANWLPKSANILDIASELGLALDSFVFIDDSPLECAEVRTRCPDVAVLPLPSDAERAVETLQHFWPLDIQELTIEATQRTTFYRQEQDRREAHQHWTQSMQEFIDSLELEVTIRPAEAADHTRMYDLMSRTTQFNLTGERHSSSEIEAMPNSIEQYVVDVKDRFGSYGTVGLMMFSTGEETLTVNTLLLSCRALGRGVEQRMLADLGQKAIARRLHTIHLRYVATERNQPGRLFLDGVAKPLTDPSAPQALYAVPASEASNTEYKPDLMPTTPPPSPPHGVGPSAERSAGYALAPWPQLDLVAAELTTAHSIREAMSDAVYERVADIDGRTDEEQRVSRIWADILQAVPGHADNDFRSLGGGSLEIVQLLARVYEEFGVEIPVDLLLDNRFTVRNVVAMIELLRTNGTGSFEGDVPWMES